MILATAALLTSLSAGAVAASTATYSLPLQPSTTVPLTVSLVVSRFESLDRGMTSLSATFKQSVTWQQSGAPQTVEGRLEYRKPDRLRVEHSAPERQTVVSDGRWLWIWRPGTNQVVQSRLEDWKKSEPLAEGLLDFARYAEMLRRYDVEISTVGAPDAQGQQRFELLLRPKEGDRRQDFLLRLRLDTRRFFPDDAELDVGGVSVRSQFFEIQYNPPLTDSRFKFTPPAGADVFQNFKLPRTERP